MMKRLTGLALMLMLTACGGDEQTVDFSGWETASLTYSYPADEQKAVPLHAPLVLRFSHALTTSDPGSEVSLETAAGDPLPFSVAVKASGRSLIVTPDRTLPPATDLVLRAGDQQSKVGGVELPEEGVRFTTRAQTEGAASAVATASEFRVARMIPDGGDWPLMDFSTLRLQFTQPVDRETLDYGSSVSLRDGSGQLVDAHVIVRGHYLSIDPVEDLVPGNQYRLELTSGLESSLDNALVPAGFADRTITPKNSRPRETLVQKAAVSNDDPAQQCGPDTSGDRVSPLTGASINCVPIQSVLLGDESSSQQSGDVHAELAFVPNFPDVTPLRIPRGSLLKGSNVAVKVAGEVPAGFDTGEIRVKFVSDASGFLLPNPYSDDENAPRQVRLFMDVAMNTENATANGGLSQDLMHLELVGTAIVKDGRMVIDAVGVVEPEVLGLETAHGTLSFHMESYRDQTSTPPMLVDQTLPELQSWMPGDEGADEMRPGDPLIVHFTEPLDRQSLRQSGALTLRRSGTPVPFDWYLDGASLVVKPETPLAYGAQYELSVTGAATDLAGNPLAQDYTKSFTMPGYVGNGDRAPLALTTYPGYPCATTGGNLANDNAGRCRGGQGSDDALPVMDLPANRPIEVQFSQTMAASSIELGGSFQVERSANPDGTGGWSPVDGELKVFGRRLRFYPDQPWEDGALYRYTLGSNGNPDSASAVCNGTDAICSRRPDGSIGFPLQTRVLAQSPGDAPTATGGGPDMVIPFHGAPATDSVLQTLRNMPTSDVNANLVHEAGESGPTEDPDNPGQYLTPRNGAELGVVNTGGLLLDANVGCPIGDSCPENKFLYLTGALNAEVVGYDAGEDAVRVNVFPTLLMTSSVDVYSSIFIAGDKTIPTGPQVMRVRYAKDGSGNRTQPVTGWIRETPQGPILEITLDVYLSAPWLKPEALSLELDHDLYGYPLTLKLSGPVEFLDDGRMKIEQVNVEAPDDITVNLSLIGIGAASMTMAIPEGGAKINYFAIPPKR